VSTHPIKPWKVISKKDVSPSKWFPVEQHTVELADGNIIDDFYVSVLNPVAMVIAVTRQNKIVFVQQYKHGIGEVMIELPSGFARNEQSPEQAAVAELEEETGIKVELQDLIPLGKIAVHPSKSKCVVHGFLIKDVEFNSQQNLDVTEQINVLQLSVEEAFAAIKSGEIWAVDTVAFLFKAKELL
jgi:8-oxo-dGTP pyrophosphatase MutT (NUDIX family)